MADTTGPTSSLPGSEHPVPPGQMCDAHQHLPATHRIQGTTDAFGAELIDMCDQCHIHYMLHDDPVRCGVCDWCKREAVGLRDYRDINEGMAGPVYDVCPDCIKIDQDRLADDLDQDDDPGALNSPDIDDVYFHQLDDMNPEGDFNQWPEGG